MSIETTLTMFSLLLQAVSGYLLGPSEVTGAIGGSVIIPCYFNPISANIHGRKFWCKMTRQNCITIISTNNYIAQNYINRTNLVIDRNYFQINMTNLQRWENGIYRCGIGNNNNLNYYNVNLTISGGKNIPYSTVIIIANFKESITINCPVHKNTTTKWNYWCKMNKKGGPTCDMIVNSSGYVHKNFWGRVLIHEVSNTSDFKVLVNNIKINDFGFYRCGTGKFEDGSNWTDIHIHTINPSDTIRHWNSKPLIRSPGELFEVQCKIPKSFLSVSLVYWCHWNETGCLRLIDSDGFIQEGFQSRISMSDRTYTIKISQLELGDTGYYWCFITDGKNIETSSVEVHIIETTTSHYSQTLSSTGNVSFATLLTTNIRQENTTWDHITITERNQTGGATIAQIATVPIPTTNSTQG
ncbi:hypothetical protein GDO81_006330 [Engystomops pustulosus]|uniref:Polymeric immunoglobulin receptor n=1 Tax=Engystomops pustulosus TaxID=76066 RepID=A0AAV7CVW1_ENGPU|nr:hypothetical protein GDO81_006330 [Engystomops pustulosus]